VSGSHPETQPGAGDVTAHDEAVGTARGELGRGAMIGRYVLVSRLGAGGMGVVFAAYDPELDRRIAIKFLHPELGSREASERLLREAQTMAKLSHPNVVIVHDVGTFEGHVYIAMEYVAGKTLQQWTSAATRTWSEVVDVMRRAGEGLAAAHDKGIVHRDFKPDNVMVGDDGSVRVMDFGLARRGGSDVITTAEGQAAVGSLSLTRSGALLGTPRYMAAEQFAGAPADARSDQFAFCVALYEGLFGARPFEGDVVAALADAVASGSIAQTPAGRDVPAWLRAVVFRGLSADPTLRWPSMRALLDALDDRSRRGRRGWWIGAAVVAVAAGGWGVHAWRERAASAACVATREAMDAVWNDDARDALRAGITGTGLGYATALVDRVMPIVDAHVAAWIDARAAACDAERSSPLPPEFAAAQAACFDEASAALERWLAVLSGTPSRAAVRQSIVAASTLGDVAACNDLRALGRRPAAPDDPTLLAQVREVEAELANVATLRDLGELATATASARSCVERADDLQWPPLRARASLALGSVLLEVGDDTEAVAVFDQAAVRAGLAGDPDTIVAAQLGRMTALGQPLKRLDEAERAALLVEEALAVQGREGTVVHGKWHLEYGAVLQERDQLEQARAHYEAAGEIWRATLGPGHPELTTVVSHLATLASARGDYEESRALHQEHVAACEETLGPDHPRTGMALVSLGAVEHSLGHYDESEAITRRAVRILEAASEYENRVLALAYGNLGGALMGRGKIDEAAIFLERSLAGYEAALGPDHASIAPALDNLAMVEAQRGNYHRAVGLFRRALVVEEAALGPDHPSLAFALTGLGDAEHRLGHDDEAVGLLQRAIALLERAHGPDFPDLGHPLNNLGIVYAAKDQHAEAAAAYRRAIAVWERLGPDHPSLAVPLGNLGNAELALAKRDPATRTARLEAARSAYARALAIDEATLGADSIDLVDLLQGLGEVALEQRRRADAVGLLERAERIGVALPAGDPEHAVTRELLLRARGRSR